MSVIPPLESTPVEHLAHTFPVKGSISNPDGEACFTCAPPYQHSREWIPDPNGSKDRRLVLCFDGTGDSFDEDNSNVVKFLAMLKKDDTTKQLVYYQAGIGTYTSSVYNTPILESLAKLRDKMVARHLGDHVKDGYQFLMQNYRIGDQICIFGFSRGAFTARVLAGMLQKIGLLPPCNLEQLPFAYAMYKRDDEKGFKLSLQFKRTFSIDVKVRFLGVWDTVQSIGWVSKHLPFCGSNNAITHFRHALALDERRVKFIPSFYAGGKAERERADSKVSEDSESINEKGHHKIGKRQRFERSYEYELYINAMNGQETDAEEVFFSGAHCDVGGGSVENGERSSLARIPLRWMIRECFKVNTGIVFDAHMLEHEVGLDIDSIHEAPKGLTPTTLHFPGSDCTKHKVFSSQDSAPGLPFWTWVKPSKLSPHNSSQVTFSLEHQRFISQGEAQEELDDVLSPVYDQLKKHVYWKVMEWIPLIIGRHGADMDGSGAFWARKLVWNRGKGRIVYRRVMERGMKVHRSVRTRMLACATTEKKEQYLPKIRCVVGGQARRLTREEWLADPPEHFEWVDC